ncbi:sensor histidine kinase [Streptomonospora sp. S1-112]|uniref:histidine kinase n=1 Tax=Streptomonospora mangrovi TaxID=2883123 RepID=A0A9X3NNS6_9ACTN|nr:sensor histidine kinase [Streptomonospora mangrovi]MDA0565548.1 sensor histidine kinase [Streptomonospora mangrovi]
MARTDHRPANRFTLFVWSLLLVAHAAASVVLTVLSLVAASLSAIWVGLPLLLALTRLLRGHAQTHRRLLGHLLADGPVPDPGYRPLPDTRLRTQISVVLADPTARRDYIWLATNATLGLTLAALPLTLLAHAVQAVLYVWLWRWEDSWYALHPVAGQADAYVALVTATALFALFWLLTPPIMHAYALLNRRLLAPNENARLAARVEHLATSRAETIDAQASEVRRIERDLHDGAQARLVALGMSLGMAEEMLAADPDLARRMLTEARETTRQALTELRDLVRGIHPPVLVERGLEGAVRALAITQHLPITVDIDLPGRPADPVESAAYFAVAELLTNAAKHANADRAWVRINYGRGRMVVIVGDDGVGGLDPDSGTGLPGIRRRLSAFDGTMSCVSPAGGPTIVTMELPCALRAAPQAPPAG